MPTSGEIRIGAARFGATDWREVRRSVGLVSASLGHEIEPDQTARDVILSGRDGADQFLAADNPRRGKTGRALSAPGAGHASRGPALAPSFPGRTPARAHRARADGAAQNALSRRTVRGTRPRGAGGFSQIFGALLAKASRAHARFGHPSRGGNRAALHPRPSPARRRRSPPAPRKKCSPRPSQPPRSARPSRCAAPAAAIASRWASRGMRA
jgi:hypothetical protein